MPEYVCWRYANLPLCLISQLKSICFFSHAKFPPCFYPFLVYYAFKIKVQWIKGTVPCSHSLPLVLWTSISTSAFKSWEVELMAAFYLGLSVPKSSCGSLHTLSSNLRISICEESWLRWWSVVWPYDSRYFFECGLFKLFGHFCLLRLLLVCYHFVLWFLFFKRKAIKLVR